MKKKILLIALISMLVLSACSSASRDAITTPAEVPAAMPDYGAPVTEEAWNKNEGGTAYDAAGQQAQVERVVLKTAEISLSVAKPNDSMNEISAMAARLGGFVVSSYTWKDQDYSSGRSYDKATIVIRVPADKLDATLAEIRAMSANGTEGVISESQSGQDVTSDFVDSESRLRNLKAAEAQLMELMKNTTDLANTMEVFRELTNIRGQIEVLQGHINYLREAADLSSISVTLVAEASLQPIEIGGWKPQGVVRESLEKLVRSFQSLVDFLIRFGITCLPFLIPLGVGIYFLVKALRKRSGNRPSRRKNKDMASPTAVIEPMPEEPEEKN
jgi:hypothetical protein